MSAVARDSDDSTSQIKVVTLNAMCASLTHQGVLRPARARKVRRRIRSMLQRVGLQYPDVVMLQEVSHSAVVEELQRWASRNNMRCVASQHLPLHDADGRELKIGPLSRMLDLAILVSERFRPAGPPQSRMWHKLAGCFGASLAVPVWKPKQRAARTGYKKRKIVLETVHCLPPVQVVEAWSRQQPFGSVVRVVAPMIGAVRSSALKTMVADRLEWCASARPHPAAYVLAGDFNLQQAELDGELRAASKNLLKRVASSVRSDDCNFAVDHVVVNHFCTRRDNSLVRGARSNYQLDFVKPGLSDHHALACSIACA